MLSSFFWKIEVQDLGFLLEDALDDVQIECLVIYIGEERCSKLIPNCVISCIHSIYFPKVPQGKNIQRVDGVVPPPQFALFIPN